MHPLKGTRPFLGGPHTLHRLPACPLHGLGHGYRACALLTRNSNARSHWRLLSRSAQAEGTRAEDRRRRGRKARPAPSPGRRGRRGAGTRVQETQSGKPPASRGRGPTRALHAPSVLQTVRAVVRTGRGRARTAAPHTRRQSPALPGRASQVVTREAASLIPPAAHGRSTPGKGTAGVHDAWRGPTSKGAHGSTACKSTTSSNPSAREGDKRSDDPATRWEESRRPAETRGLPLRICAVSSDVLLVQEDAAARQQQSAAVTSRGLGPWQEEQGGGLSERCVPSGHARALLIQNKEQTGLRRSLLRGLGHTPQFQSGARPPARHSQPPPAPARACLPQPALEPMQCSLTAPPSAGTSAEPGSKPIRASQPRSSSPA